MRKPKTPRPYHHGDLYETLVKAGTDILNSDGLAKFTLRACARRAGVSHAAPKNHFASVDDLLSEISARGFDQFVAELAAMADASPAQTPDDRLIAMGQAYVAFACANPGVYLMMFRHAHPFTRSEHLMKAASAAWAQLEQAVAKVIGKEGSEAKARSAHVWALVHGIASLIIDKRFPAGVPPDLVVKQSMQSLPAAIRGLGQA